MPSSWHYWDPTPSWMAQMTTGQGPLVDDLPGYMGNLRSLYKDSYEPNSTIHGNPKPSFLGVINGYDPYIDGF